MFVRDSADAGRAHWRSVADQLRGKSWFNQGERWFGTLTQKYIRPSTHRSTRQLEQAIGHYIKFNNDDRLVQDRR